MSEGGRVKFIIRAFNDWNVLCGEENIIPCPWEGWQEIGDGGKWNKNGRRHYYVWQVGAARQKSSNIISKASEQAGASEAKFEWVAFLCECDNGWWKSAV